MATVPRVPPTDAYAGHYIRPDDDRLHVSVGGIRIPASIGTPSGKRYSSYGECFSVCLKLCVSILIRSIFHLASFCHGMSFAFLNCKGIHPFGTAQVHAEFCKKSPSCTGSISKPRRIAENLCLVCPDTLLGSTKRRNIPRSDRRRRKKKLQSGKQPNKGSHPRAQGSS